MFQIWYISHSTTSTWTMLHSVQKSHIVICIHLSQSYVNLQMYNFLLVCNEWRLKHENDHITSLGTHEIALHYHENKNNVQDKDSIMWSNHTGYIWLHHCSKKWHLNNFYISAVKWVRSEDWMQKNKNTFLQTREVTLLKWLNVFNLIRFYSSTVIFH